MMIEEQIDYRTRYKEALKRQIVSSTSAVNGLDSNLEGEADVFAKFDSAFIHELSQEVAQDINSHQLASLVRFVTLVVDKKVEEKTV